MLWHDFQCAIHCQDTKTNKLTNSSTSEKNVSFAYMQSNTMVMGEDGIRTGDSRGIGSIGQRPVNEWDECHD